MAISTIRAGSSFQRGCLPCHHHPAENDHDTAFQNSDVPLTSVLLKVLVNKMSCGPASPGVIVRDQMNICWNLSIFAKALATKESGKCSFLASQHLQFGKWWQKAVTQMPASTSWPQKSQLPEAVSPEASHLLTQARNSYSPNQPQWELGSPHPLSRPLHPKSAHSSSPRTYNNNHLSHQPHCVPQTVLCILNISSLSIPKIPSGGENTPF